MIIKDVQNQIVQQLRAADIETATLDARLLMMHALGNVTLEELLLRRGEDFPFDLQSTLNDCVEKRVHGMPIAKIIGVKEFWGLPFKTSVNTLDPRPDSETLIEAVLENLPDREKPYRILDLGTGTGCLLISLLHELPNAIGFGVDQSETALSLAQVNAQILNVSERSNWQVSDWLSNVTGQFDIIISNPPYIPSDDIDGLSIDVRAYDPLSALDGGQDGLNPYRAIATQISPFLNENSIVAVEYGQGQMLDIHTIFGKEIALKPMVYKDLSGIERISLFKG